MAEKGKRIGYVDHELENFHSNVYLKILRGELKDRGFEVAGCTATNKETGKAWAAKNQVPWFDSVAAMNDHVDCYAVLAPGNPETHLALCEQTFPFRKTTYVDKTFAPNTATAKNIFALAKKHKVAMQTSSALRYTAVQAFAREVGRENVRHMVAWGPGRSFGEYAIHPVEMVVSCMGAEAVGLMRRGTGNQSQLLVNFTGDRTAVINVYISAKTPYAASVTTDAETRYFAADTGRIFVDMAIAFLELFASGTPNIPPEETLAIMRILDAAADPRALKRFVSL